MVDLYIYHLGLKCCIKQELKPDIERYIIDTTSKFLGDRESIPIQEDPLALRSTIHAWLKEGKINEGQAETFCNRIRDCLHTRSVESERTLVIYLRRLNSESILYLIHTKEKMDVVSEDFQQKLKVGLSPEKILRVLQFSKYEPDKIQVNFKEINKTQFLLNLFNIPSDRFDSVGEVSIKCNFDANMDITITMSPRNFLSYHANGNLQFVDDYRSLRISDNWILKLREIKYKTDVIGVNKRKINDFIKKLKDFDDPYEEMIEKYRADYKSKKQQLGLVKDDSLWAFIEKKDQVDPNSMVFHEDIEIVRVSVGGENIATIKKPIDPWGVFLVMDELIKLSDEFSLDLARDIWTGLPRNTRFINIDYQTSPFKVGRYSYYNNFRLSETTEKIIQDLQSEFDSSTSRQRKKLLLISMLFVMQQNTNLEILKDFCATVRRRLIVEKGTQISRDIPEDRIFEFKRGDILDSSLPIKNRISNLSEAIRPNLNITGLCIALIGYDEVADQITPIDFTFYKSEIREQLITGIKRESGIQDLKVDISLIGNGKNNGVLLLTAMNPNKMSMPDLGELFQ